MQISLFSEGPNRTFVRLMHEGWDQFPHEAIKPFYDQLGKGWKSSVLPNLRRAAEAKR